MKSSTFVLRSSANTLTTRQKKERLDLAFERMNDDDLKFILDNQVRRVKWLYNNSNRMTMVYDEKMVRLIIQKIENRYKGIKFGGLMSEL